MSRGDLPESYGRFILPFWEFSTLMHSSGVKMLTAVYSSTSEVRTELVFFTILLDQN